MVNVQASWYQIRAKKDEDYAEMSITDEIGLWGVSARDFINDMKRVKGRRINLTLHTPGGDVGDGIAIYEALAQHDGGVSIRIEGIAASMGSVIMLASDDRSMSDNSMIMIHNPWTIAAGDAEAFEKAASDMRKFESQLVNIYVKRTGLDEQTIRDMMDAETWMTAEEALANGFVGEVYETTKAAAKLCDFRGQIAARLGKTGPTIALQKVKQPETKIAMSDNKNTPEDKSLELQAKIDELNAALESKETEIAELKKLAEAASAQGEDGIAVARAEAAKIVDYGRVHGKIELAVAAIEQGKSVEQFKGELLDSYAKGSAPATPVAQEVEIDANKEPSSRTEFLATYNTLKGRERGAYWDKHSKTFLA